MGLESVKEDCCIVWFSSPDSEFKIKKQHVDVGACGRGLSDQLTLDHIAF